MFHIFAFQFSENWLPLWVPHCNLNLIPQMLSVKLNLFWTRNIPLISFFSTNVQYLRKYRVWPVSACTMVEWRKRDSIKKKIGLGFSSSNCKDDYCSKQNVAREFALQLSSARGQGQNWGKPKTVSVCLTSFDTHSLSILRTLKDQRKQFD